MMQMTRGEEFRSWGRKGAYVLLGFGMIAWGLFVFILEPGISLLAGLLTISGMLGLAMHRSVEKPLINPVWGKPVALVLALFAIVGLGQWASPDVTQPTSHPIWAAIIFGGLGIVIWFASNRKRQASPEIIDDCANPGLLDEYDKGEVS